MLIYKPILCHFAIIFMIKFILVSSDDIPTMLWNIKGNALRIKPVAALGHNDESFTENLKDILHQDSSIVVFTVNKLSLEDFSVNDRLSALNNTLHNVELFLDTQPYMFLPSVKDPLNYIHKTHCGVQEIVVDNKIDESIMQSVSSAMLRSCVVILHISDDGIVSKQSELRSVFLPSFENSNKNIVGVFTGVKSSWGPLNSEHHIFRNLLQAVPSDENFLNYTGCIIMYANNGSITINGSVVDLPFAPTLDGSECGNNTDVLQLNFQTSGVVSSVTIRFEFLKAKGYWTTNGTLSTTGERTLNIDLNTESMEAPIGFSFSCGDMVLKPKTRELDLRGIFVKMDRFQIQPYQIMSNGFSESFDCVPFFTIPIWMGIFVSLLFIIITSIGVYALFSVHTMDRFDDPKGKSISVGAAVD